MDTHSSFITGATAALLLIGLAAAGTAQAAKMYKWTDENGQVHYSQTKPQAQKADTMKIKDSNPPQAKPAPKKEEPEDFEDKNNPAVQARKKNCEIAKLNLATYQNSKRVKRPDGTVVELDDELRQSKISEAQAMIDQNCK